MEFKSLQYAVREHVAHVTLDRPSRLNALDGLLTNELRVAAASIGADSAVRAVLLTGAGRAFCAGADLAQGELIDAPGRSLGEAVQVSLREHMNPMIEAWHGLPVPVVVAVNGVAAGAGVSLALLGDIVIAARSATFVQLFAPKVGLMPDLGCSYHLPRLVGTARAKGLALLGEPLSAVDAEHWGLIWKCVDDTALLDAAQTLASRLASGPTQAFERIKRVFNRAPSASLGDQLTIEEILQTELAQTQDFAEGLRAFRDKRTPQFSGR